MPSPRREDGDALRCGDRGAAVTEIRAALAALGMLDNPDEDLTTGRHVALEVFDENSTTRCVLSSSTVGCWWTASSARPPIAR